MSIHNKREKAERDEAWRRVRLSQKAVDEIGEDRGLWYENPDEIASTLRRGQMRAVRLRWVLRQMERRLDVRERRCLELYYLEGRSFREVAAEVGITKAIAARTIQNAIEKLRAAAAMSRLGTDGKGMDVPPSDAE